MDKLSVSDAKLSLCLIAALSAVGAGCSKDADWNSQPPTLGPAPTGSARPLGGGPAPTFGATTTLSNSPPALSGGTLLIAQDGQTAVASDPDRDAIYMVDLSSRAVQTLSLTPGDEPGRAVEDAAGKVHVALRGGGAIVDVDPIAGTLLGRRAVCPAPRGIAYDAATDHLLVACVGGELVTLAASGGPTLSTVQVDKDLRDVFIVKGQLYVSRFRSAELLQLGANGSINRLSPSPSNAADGGTMDATVAWRTVGLRSSIAMVHQLSRRAPVPTVVPYYTTDGPSGCNTSIVESTVSFFDASSSMPPDPFPVLDSAVLPVDLAFSQDESTFAVVSAGNGHTPDLPTIYKFDRASYQAQAVQAPAAGTPCVTPPNAPAPQKIASLPVGQPIAVAFDGQNNLIVQSREPAALYTYGSTSAPIVLSSATREDTGHAIFHSNSGGYIACASCHAEGGEDGHVWTLDVGARRTQSLRGTLNGTAPYHWDGELADIPALAHEIFTVRMSGPELASDQSQALQTWLFARPAPAVTPPTDSASIARGQTLFADPTVACSSCHSGSKFTNNTTVDVGTGAAFQVPSLIGVAWRAPYLHSGCATTLQDRFDPNVINPLTSDVCAGRQHGNTSQLSQAQIADLINYLETL
jgi:mono/diheme cytochrome c family protein